MRCLERNKSGFWYANYVGKTDPRGDGEKTISYTQPKYVRANLSPSTGRVFVDRFGNAIDYDKVIVTDNIHLPITESSILFIDVDPEQDQYGNWNYDYVVRKIATSLNSMTIAISRRDVS